MTNPEFDRFADSYVNLHAENISISGEGPEYFAEYKVKELARLLPTTSWGSVKSILDFGGGIGSSVPHFNKYFPRSEVTCLDISEKSLELGDQLHRGKANFRHFDGLAIPFPSEHFDIVFVSCVLHHISHTLHLGALREINRVLRRSGVVFIYEHNPFNPLTVHTVNNCVFDENAVLIQASRLSSTVSAAGFDCPEVRYRVFFPRALRLFRPLEKYLSWLPFGAQYSIFAKKAPLG